MLSTRPARPFAGSSTTRPSGRRSRCGCGWDGRTDAGQRVSDGRYRVRVTLRREGRSVTVPATTLVDTLPPRPRVKAISPGPIIGPIAGARSTSRWRSISRRLIKRARVWRTDGGEPRVVADLPPVENTRTMRWDGKVAGEPAPPGIYLVQLIARDRAGNQGITPAEVPPERGESRGTRASRCARSPQRCRRAR